MLSGLRRRLTVVFTLVTGAVVYALGRFMPDEPEEIVIDPNWMHGLAAGVVGYLFGRSRRGAFIAGVIGAVLVFRPTESARIVTMLLGMSLLAEGILNLCVALCAVKIIRHQQPDVIEIDIE